MGTTSDPIYVVLVNFRNPGDTIICIQSLLRFSDRPLKIMLVENGSGDESLSIFRKWLIDNAIEADRGQDRYRLGEDIETILIPGDENLGFAGGCNLGIDQAMQDPACRYIWLLNNDTEIRERTIGSLIKRLEEQPKVDMCGSTLLYYHSPDIVQACAGRFNLALGRGKPIGAHLSAARLPEQAWVEKSMQYVVGASMMVTRRWIEEVGRMEDRLFLYFEELDWAMRGKRKNLSIGWAPASVVLHKEGGAIGTSTTQRPSNLSIYFMRASYLRISYIHNPALTPIALLWSVIAIAKWAFKRDVTAVRTELLAIGNFIRSPRRCLPKTELPRVLKIQAS